MSPNDGFFDMLIGGPALIVISGPSGVGKDAVIMRLCQGKPAYHLLVTTTTRAPRVNERNGHHYNFIEKDEFLEIHSLGGFIESAEVYGHLYGVPKASLKDALAQSQNVIIKADVQGAATIKRIIPESVSILLCPSSVEELEARLNKRDTETLESRKCRLQTALQEMDQASLFDYVVVNVDGKLDETIQAIESIVAAERFRYPRRLIKL